MCHAHPPANTYPHFCEYIHVCRAADPSLNLSVAKSDVKHSNNFRVMDKTNLCSSLPGKMHRNCLAWSGAERCCAPQENLWKAPLPELCPKAVKTAMGNKMGNLQHPSYRFSFVDVMLWVDVSFNTVPSATATEKVVSPGSDTSNGNWTKCYNGFNWFLTHRIKKN